MFERTPESSRLDFFGRKRSGEKGVLKAFEVNIFKTEPVTIGVQGNSLPDNVTGAGNIFDSQVARSEIVRVNEDGLRSECASLQSVFQYFITAEISGDNRLIGSGTDKCYVWLCDVKMFVVDAGGDVDFYGCYCMYVFHLTVSCRQADILFSKDA
jgi:hypothetical protein